MRTVNDEKIVFPSAPYSKISLHYGSASILISSLMKAAGSTGLLLPVRGTSTGRTSPAAGRACLSGPACAKRNH